MSDRYRVNPMTGRVVDLGDGGGRKPSQTSTDSLRAQVEAAPSPVGRPDLAILADRGDGTALLACRACGNRTPYSLRHVRVLVCPTCNASDVAGPRERAAREAARDAADRREAEAARAHLREAAVRDAERRAAVERARREQLARDLEALADESEGRAAALIRRFMGGSR